MGFYRDIFTGELKERETQCPDTGRAYTRGEIPEGAVEDRAGSVWGRPWVSEALGVSNPDQIKDFNEAAAKHAGPGVYYDTKGRLVCESRAARNRALAFLDKIDYDGGYGDRTESRRAA